MSLRPQIKKEGLSRFQAINARLDQASTPLHLTPRECEVIHWVTEGKRDREIAVILGVSPRTVEKHVGHILEKLGVETRTGAVNECRHSPARCQTSFTNKQVEGSRPETRMVPLKT
jgi:DNA-binding CsgD family transcriptional regulator